MKADRHFSLYDISGENQREKAQLRSGVERTNSFQRNVPPSLSEDKNTITR